MNNLQLAERLLELSAIIRGAEQEKKYRSMAYAKENAIPGLSVGDKVYLYDDSVYEFTVVLVIDGIGFYIDPPDDEIIPLLHPVTKGMHLTAFDAAKQSLDWMEESLSDLKAKVAKLDEKGGKKGAGQIDENPS